MSAAHTPGLRRVRKTRVRRYLGLDLVPCALDWVAYGRFGGGAAAPTLRQLRTKVRTARAALAKVEAP